MLKISLHSICYHPDTAKCQTFT